ncbi:glycoside hydrolase family 108 protein [Pseudovibrio sp. Tun.PSC04-5.I4]|uniref:glycoside hydrolase family 108 protein n=1 Tax=Pseudovibrio sp. Tun.PSC04-5.I4 TaxID=1798213 RepID=UPI00088491BD|nr:glycoside hydrolase family 108 protein [Pseudovibrio sp. Tun.PSC04-5.I4]SDR12538.1 Lysozyme family protein [Pseudovibrio sp. Tun.PSC04-5.I4]
MKNNFELVLTELLSIEGGFANRSHKADPGGPTNFGITQGTLSAWRGRSVSVQEVRTLSQAEAIEIFRTQYWEAVQGDKLPSGLDYALFDFAVNSGPGRAVKTLQALLGVAADGIVGLQTLGAIKQRVVLDLINALCTERLAFMKRLRNWTYNKNGWPRRVSTVQERSVELARKPEAASKILPVLDAKGAEGGAKARGEETSALSAWLTPEGLSKAGVLVSGVSGVLAGSGPLQWSFAFALVAAVGIGGYLMVQKERVA